MIKYNPKDKLNSIINSWTLEPFKPLRWPEYPAQLLYIDNAIALTYPNGDGFCFQFGSKDYNAITFMYESTDDTSEMVNISDGWN
jgi:hypothetical protein